MQARKRSHSIMGTPMSPTSSIHIFFIMIPIRAYSGEGYGILMRTREGDKLNIRGRACQKDDVEYFKQMHLSHILGFVLSSLGFLSIPFRRDGKKKMFPVYVFFSRGKHVICVRS